MEYALAQSLISKGIRPDIVLGTSLGEITALVVADSLSFREGLDVVIEQACKVVQFCQKASMLAILESPDIYEEEALFAGSELAAINFAQHFIVTSSKEEVSELENRLRKRNITYQHLPVSYGFHSSLIDAAAAPYLRSVSAWKVMPPHVPYYSCVTATSSSVFSNEHLWDIVRYPIRFQETIQLLLSQGDYHFIDVGPGGTLATFLKYNLGGTEHRNQIHSILSPFDGDLRRLVDCCAAVSY